MRFARKLFLAAILTWTAAVGAVPDSQPGLDAPELARLGAYAVGVRTITLVDRVNPDVPAADPKPGEANEGRSIAVDIWYPARAQPKARPETYSASMPAEPPGSPVAFTVEGIAVRGAAAVPGRRPLVIVSHGYHNATAAMIWLTENLASKGYVVAAIRHEDGESMLTPTFPHVLLRRPLDIVFVAAQLQSSLAAEGIVDPDRAALVGYSMGGFGVLTAGGATLDPTGGAMKYVPEGVLRTYGRGGAKREVLRVHGLRGIVAISPAGGGALSAWGSEGLAAIAAPLLLIAGDRDRTVDYGTGARTFFQEAVGAPRYLLTYKNGGHNLGLGSPPEAMRKTLWDLDWFEDPVWRKDRMIGINLHVITAFLDLYVKGDATRAAYLDGLVPDSEAGVWPEAKPGRWDAISDGKDGVTVWRGFPRRHAVGLQLRHLGVGER